MRCAPTCGPRSRFSAPSCALGRSSRSPASALPSSAPLLRPRTHRLARHLEETHGARVTHVSGNLADRARLRDDLAQTDADVFVVELKAAAVDVVVEEARRRGVRVVLAANDVLPIAGERSLDVELERLAAEAIVHAPQAVR